MKDLKQAAKDFCEQKEIDNLYTLCENPELTYEGLLIEFAKHLVDKGDLMTTEDYQRFKDEYKAEVDCDALCCAVAEVEMGSP